MSGLSTALLIIIAVLVLGLGVVIFLYNHERTSIDRKIDEAEAETIAKETEKNEKKESMESGNGTADFNASVELLHDLAKKGK